MTAIGRKVYCRGYWDNLLLHNYGTLSFSVESAWNGLNETREFIKKIFPEVKLYYQCEENGMCIYKTNDDTGHYFPEKCYLWVEGSETLYHNNLESLISYVENITGSKRQKTLDSCKKALESYSRKNHDLCYTLEEFSVVDDSSLLKGMRLKGRVPFFFGLGMLKSVKILIYERKYNPTRNLGLQKFL